MNGIIQEPCDLKEAKRNFSRLGLGIFVMLVLSYATQLLLIVLLRAVWPQALSYSFAATVLATVPLYLVAIPVGLLIFRGAPARCPEKQSLGASTVIVMTIIGFSLMYVGNFVGVLANTVLQLLSGVSIENPVVSYTEETDLLTRAVFMVLLAPVIEEFVFRKQLIDRMNVYGERLSVVVSALLFGLFHGNLSQFFYAFATGLVLGYAYLKSGRLRYGIGMHMLINFMGAVVAPLFSEKIAAVGNLENPDVEVLLPYLPWILGCLVYVFALLGLTVTGLILLFVCYRRVSFARAALELPQGSQIRTVLLNVGMLLASLGCVALIVLSILPI